MSSGILRIGIVEGMSKKKKYLPLPLAQLKRRANNAKSAQERHLAAYYFWEAGLKLLASTAIVEYAQHPSQDDHLDDLWRSLAKPSTGHWWDLIRRLVPLLADRGDAGFTRVRDLVLGRSRHDLPFLVGLNREVLKLVRPDQNSAALSTVNLSELFHQMVAYRNRIIGHGGLRTTDFFAKMGDVMLRGLTELYEHLDILAGRRLVFISEVELDQSGKQRIHRFELAGLEPYRLPDWVLQERIVDRLPKPNSLYLVRSLENSDEDWRLSCLTPLYPLAIYDTERSETLLLNGRRGRDQKMAGYLGYLSGHEHSELASDLTFLLDRVMLTKIRSADLEAWATQSEIQDLEAAPIQGEVREPRRLAEFELISRIGRGGMGVVYRAFQPSLGRQVAIKRLAHPGNAQSVARFSREIRALGQVDHPHLVKIFCSGTDGEDWFYAMELVEGADLGNICEEFTQSDIHSIDETSWQAALSTACQKVRSREEMLSDDPDLNHSSMPEGVMSSDSSAVQVPMEKPRGTSRTHVERSVELVRQVTLAVAALHEHGVIHRDIKPGNILVDPTGKHAVLLDLGLAQLADELDGRVTRTRQFVGTLRYASPEQILSAGNLNHQTDVYSLGATLWEILTLHPLFDATDKTPTPELMLTIQSTDPPPPRRYNDQVDADLQAIVLKCLEKDRKLRYESADELAADLERWQNQEPVEARNAGVFYSFYKRARRYRRHVRTGLVLGILLVLTSLLTMSFYRSQFASKATPSESNVIAEDQVEDQIQKLLLARTSEVPQLIEEMRPFSDELQSKMIEALDRAQSKWNHKQSVNLALALVDDHPPSVDVLKAEMILSDPEEFLIIRQALEPYSERINESLWMDMESPIDDGPFGDPHSSKLRAAMVLSPEYSKNPVRWKPHLRFIVDQMIQEVIYDPSQLEAIAKSLAPLREELELRLSYVLHHPDRIRQEAAAHFIGEFNKTNPAALAELALSHTETPQTFSHFFYCFEDSYDSAPDATLAGETTVPYSAFGDVLFPNLLTGDDRPIGMAYEDYYHANRAIRNTAKESGWMVTKDRALSHAAPWNEWLKTANTLRHYGFRPIRCRPYTTTEGVKVASSFVRDGVNWVFAYDLKPEQVRAMDQELQHRSNGYVPIDVAGYVFADHRGWEYERYCGIWAPAKVDQYNHKHRLLVGLSFGEWREAQSKLRRSQPKTVQIMPAALLKLSDSYRLRYSGIWTIPEWELTDFEISSCFSLDQLVDLMKAHETQNQNPNFRDVDVTQYSNSQPPEEFWSGCFQRASEQVKKHPNNQDVLVEWIIASWHSGNWKILVQERERIQKIVQGTPIESECCYFFSLAELKANKGHAKESLDHYLDLVDDVGGTSELIARYLHAQGKHPRAMQILEEAIAAVQQAEENERNGKYYNLACSLSYSAGILEEKHNTVLANQCKTRALEVLGMAIETGWFDVRFLQLDTDLNSIRKTPEFARIIKKINQPFYAIIHEQLSEKKPSEQHTVQPSLLDPRTEVPRTLARMPSAEGIPLRYESVGGRSPVLLLASSVLSHQEAITAHLDQYSESFLLSAVGSQQDFHVASCLAKEISFYEGDLEERLRFTWTERTAHACILRQLILEDDSAWFRASQLRSVSNLLVELSDEFRQWQVNTGLDHQKKWEEIDQIKEEFLSWTYTKGAARNWWMALEDQYVDRPDLVLDLVKQLESRKASIQLFYEASETSHSTNIDVLLDYLDFRVILSNIEGPNNPEIAVPEILKSESDEQVRADLQEMKNSALDWEKASPEAQTTWKNFEEQHKKDPRPAAIVAYRLANIPGGSIAEYHRASQGVMIKHPDLILQLLKINLSLDKHLKSSSKHNAKPIEKNTHPQTLIPPILQMQKIKTERLKTEVANAIKETKKLVLIDWDSAIEHLKFQEQFVTEAHDILSEDRVALLSRLRIIKYQVETIRDKHVDKQIVFADLAVSVNQDIKDAKLAAETSVSDAIVIIRKSLDKVQKSKEFVHKAEGETLIRRLQTVLSQLGSKESR